MPTRAGCPNITAQIQREVDAINDHLEHYGDKSSYHAVRIPNEPVQPTILLPKSRTMAPYTLVWVSPTLEATTLSPSIHPADLLYRLAEIKHTVYRHFPKKEV